MSAPVKWRRILQILASGQRLTRFEAERIGDHTLPQTVDRIRRNGVPVQTEIIEVPGYGGTKAHVARYSLNAAGFAAAQRILNGPEVGRG